MKKISLGLAFLLCASSVVAAPVQVAPDAPYSVPTEVLTLKDAKNKPGLFWEGFSVGDYKFYDKLVIVGRSAGIFSSKLNYRITLDFRFVDAQNQERLKGQCEISATSETSFLGLVTDTQSSNLYDCRIDEKAETEYAFEAAVASFSASTVNGDSFGLTIENDRDETRYGKTIARMTYASVTYEAIPTRYDPDRDISRIIDGYVIYRDQKPVGRVDFQGTNRNRGNITAPVAAEDGREAVIFMAAQLLSMPDMNAGYIRSTFER